MSIDFTQKSISDMTDKLRRMVREMYEEEHRKMMHEKMEYDPQVGLSPNSVKNNKTEHDMNFMINEKLPFQGLDEHGEWYAWLVITIRYKYIENPSAWELKHMNLSGDLNKMYRMIATTIRKLIHGVDSAVYTGFVYSIQDKIDRFIKLSPENTKMIGFDLYPCVRYELANDAPTETRDVEDIPIKEGVEGFVRDCVHTDDEGPMSRSRVYADYRGYCNARRLSIASNRSQFNYMFVQAVGDIHNVTLEKSRGYGGNKDIRTWKGAGYHAEYERRN